MFNKNTYLYVEDDPPSRQVMNLIMRSMGVERYSAFEDSKNFLERLNTLSERPDIILLDIQMNPYNGFEILNMIRSDPNFAQAKIIALTASVMNEEVDQLKRAGFDGAIAKPVEFREFPFLIKRIIQDESVWHIT